MKHPIPSWRNILQPLPALCLSSLLAGLLLAAENAGEIKLEQARTALRGEPKDPAQAKALLLDLVDRDKDTLSSGSLCYVYVYLGYLEDRAGNRSAAIPWYKKALELKKTDRVRECAEYGLEQPLTWIRHLDEGTTPPPWATASKISLDTAPPVVVKTVPLAGATDVDPALTEIWVTYSKAMQDGSWSWSTWGEENYPETTGEARYLSDGHTCVLPVKLKPGKFYALWLNSDRFQDFKDANGRPAVPYLLAFSTGSAGSGGERRLRALVEDFFAQNYRDITARDTLEWGAPGRDDKGNSTIRYRYRARIWDKDTVTNNEVFTFDPQGKFVSVDGLTKTAKRGAGTAGRPAPALDPSAVRTYTVNKKVADFPANEDLSTPEAAYAVFNRACASGDQAIWGRLSVESIARHFPAEAKPKPVSARAAHEWLNAEVVEVDVYRDGFAMAFAQIPHPTKKIIDIRCLERQGGRWLNAGNDVVATLEEARGLFARRCAYRDAERESSDAPHRQNSSANSGAGPDYTLALALFGDLEDLPHELDAALAATNLPAARTGVRRLANLLTNFNAAMQGTDYPFPAAMFEDLAKFRAALDQGDWSQARQLAASTNSQYRTQFRRIAARMADLALSQRLNDDQRLVMDWTDRQFRSFFDARTFVGWSEQKRAELETQLIDALKGPQTREYYQAINSLAALRSTNALPALREIAFNREEKDCRDRWMAIRALGILGDKSALPQLVHLVYYGNQNVHWWAQISLVRLTGQNFGSEWKAWGEWWNQQGGRPPFNPEIIRWWSGQPEPDKLAASLAEADRKFLSDIRPK
jgi:hypothetical protein